jgi:hypothetical protein
MFQKLRRKVYFTPKQELLIMQVPKFGKINLMIIRVIFGLLAVFSMNQLL